MAHKGFPQEKNLLDVMLMIKQKKARYNDPPPQISELSKQNALRDDELEDFNRYIKGLKATYMIPNQPNTRRVMRMNGTRQPCVSQRSVFYNKKTKYSQLLLRHFIGVYKILSFVNS